MHFAAAGGLLFAVDAVRATPDRERILVTRQIRDDLIRARQELTGRPVTEGERPALVAGYISDEVLLREAYARELHRRDGLVRKRLLELMRFLLLEEPPEPTERELHAFLDAHADAYRTPAAITFSHVYFADEPDAPAADVERALARLRANADFRGLGERFWLGHTLEGYGEQQLVQYFGPAFASRVLKLPLGQWSGPILSTRGLHLVRVEGYRQPEMPPFADLVPALRPDWLAFKREELLRRKVDELKQKYSIEVEPGAER